MFDKVGRELIARMCGDIGGSLYPYREIAAELGLKEEEVISRLKSYKSDGTLRRFGAVLRHQSAGYKANGMSVWDVQDPDVSRVGDQLASCREISHCYERPRFSDWPYNVYAMMHGKTKDEVLSLAGRIAEQVSIDNYEVLFSVREFKKTSMVYGV